MTCGNCGSRIDWNAIRQCLCYRGPVIGATRELDDEDRRIRRRIREEMRRENDIASRLTTTRQPSGLKPDRNERTDRCS